MATKHTIERLGGIMVRSALSGHVSIPQPDTGPLTRLNFFDGKFLHAEDLEREQRYHRTHVALSNRAGGAGVVHGLSASRAGERLRVEPGLAVDALGRVLLLTEQASVEIGELIEQSRRRFRIARTGRDGRARFEECESVLGEEPAAAPVEGVQLYLVTVAHAEGLCGHEDVYGRLCEDACATDSDRPYAVEGIVIRAEPLALPAPLAQPAAVALGPQHLRSLVASAFFAAEPERAPSLISGAGLRSRTWCRGAEYDNPPHVAIGVLARAGASTLFLDPWTARRERIDVPPRRYWAWRMSMRPWEVFLAQVLQFQCQLHELLRGGRPGEAFDPCAPHRLLLREVDDAFGSLAGAGRAEGGARLEAAALGAVRAVDLPRLRHRVRHTLEAYVDDGGRRLLNGGITELPPAGYLPVDPRADATLEQQVEAMAGDSLDLRFCVVRRDYVPHALEEAQHMRRISLLEGIDDPPRKPPVDILVPDGQIIRPQAAPPGLPFRGRISLTPLVVAALARGGVRTETRTFHARAMLAAAVAADASMSMFGAGHGATAGETASFSFAGSGTAARAVDSARVMRSFNTLGDSAAAIEGLREAAAEVAESGAAPVRDIEAADRTAMLANAYVVSSGAEAGRFDVTDAVTTPVPAIWFDGRCPAGLFDLGVGERVPVTAELAVALPFGGDQVPGAFELRLDAELEVAAGEDEAGAPVVAWLEGTVERRLHGAGEDADDDEPKPVATVLRIFRERADNGTRSVRIELASQALPLFAEATWGDRPLAVTAGVHLGDPADPVTAAVASQQEDPGVLDAEDAHHRQAIAALPIVGAALARPEFEQEAHARLFPPPPAAPARRVVGPLDWVLFRRRRAIDPAEVAPPVVRPPVVAPVAYQVWHARYPTQRDAADAWRALREGTLPAVDVLGSVRYAAGQPSLVAGGRSVAALAKQLPEGDTLVRLGIASARPGEGPELLDARLAAFEAATVGLIERAGGYDSTRLDGLGELLRKAAVGAVVVVCTVGRRTQRTVCHEVYATEDRTAFYELLKYGTTGRLADEPFKALGTVEFDSGATEARGELEQLGSEDAPAPLEAAGVLHDGAPPVEPLDGQARAATGLALAELPTAAMVEVAASTADAWPLGCPLATVLLIGSRG